ncbi:MAG: efflux RND transporter permease subunit [Acidaminococcaceae bacterium]
MIKTFIQRPVFTTMLVLVLVVFGIKAYPALGVDLNPEVELPLVSVTVTYTGAAPEEMETLITKPIENRVSQVAGIKTLSSTIREGYSQTVLEFELGVDPKAMASEVREKVASVRGRLPDDIDEPVVQRVDLSAQAIVAFTLASDVRSRGEIRKIVEDVIKDEILRVEGVSELNVYGSGAREFKINVNANKLALYDIPFQTVLATVNAANMNTPGGSVKEQGTELTVRTLGKFKNIDDLRNVVVSNQQGKVVKLGDVANIQDDWEEEIAYARSNQKPSVVLSIQKQSHTNTVAVTDGVMAALKKLQVNDIPSDIEINTVKDQAVYIRENVADVWSAIIFGGFLALLITYLFLQNFRATLIGGLAIPTSVIATFVLMKQMGYTLNNMSLMGLSLAVGMLIDDAIVLIENIFRHMEMGKGPMQAAQEATEELSLAILATSLALVAVFVPIGSMGEIVGQYFAQFGLTVAFAVAFSTMSAYTLTPMLSAYWLQQPQAVGKKSNPRNKYLQLVLDKFETGFQAVRVMYDEVIAFALERPKKIIGIASVTLLFNFALIPFLGIEFQPTYDSGEFSVSVKAPTGTSIERMKELVAPIEAEILKDPEVKIAAMRLGGTRTPVSQGTIDVKLVPVAERQRTMVAIMDDLRLRFKNVEELSVSVVSGQGGGRGDKRPVQVGLRGSDMAMLEGYGQSLAELIRQVPGATDVDISSSEAEPEVIVRVDQLRASALGLNASSVGAVVKLAFQGETTNNSFTVGDNDYDIRVQLAGFDRKNLDDVRNLLVSTPQGKFVRLADIAKVQMNSGPTRIDREDRQRQIAVYANTVGTSPGELVQKIEQDLIPQLNMQLGYRYKMIGQADMMAKSFSEIAKALLLAIIMIYMVLAAEFESFVQPVVIMVSLPFALIGAIMGLLVAGQTVNMMSLIGFTMLLGLVTKNAILLVDYANQARREGQELKAALKAACTLRLRPIFMTTFSTILGMLPIALGLGAGAELRQSMGVVLVGGLFTSTMLTLVVVPLVYLVVEEWKEKRQVTVD